MSYLEDFLVSNDSRSVHASLMVEVAKHHVEASGAGARGDTLKHAHGEVVLVQLNVTFSHCILHIWEVCVKNYIHINSQQNELAKKLLGNIFTD